MKKMNDQGSILEIWPLSKSFYGQNEEDENVRRSFRLQGMCKCYYGDFFILVGKRFHPYKLYYSQIIQMGSYSLAVTV